MYVLLPPCIILCCKIIIFKKIRRFAQTFFKKWQQKKQVTRMWQFYLSKSILTQLSFVNFSFMPKNMRAICWCKLTIKLIRYVFKLELFVYLENFYFFSESVLYFFICISFSFWSYIVNNLLSACLLSSFFGPWSCFYFFTIWF